VCVAPALAGAARATHRAASKPHTAVSSVKQGLVKRAPCSSFHSLATSSTRHALMGAGSSLWAHVDACRPGRRVALCARTCRWRVPGGSACTPVWGRSAPRVCLGTDSRAAVGAAGPGPTPRAPCAALGEHPPRLLPVQEEDVHAAWHGATPVRRRRPGARCDRGGCVGGAATRCAPAARSTVSLPHASCPAPSAHLICWWIICSRPRLWPTMASTTVSQKL
jgi:hypothetical protein